MAHKTVAVAMSGGVDSSLAAALLLQEGCDVCGITMKQIDGVGDAAVRDAKKVADTLGIRHEAFDATGIFKSEIIDYFCSEYAAGRTPNPCVRCNRRIKFGLLFDRAQELGCEYLATGHYARIDSGVLRRGLDTLKDQSYFLYVIYGSHIEKILFPLGHMRKEQTRGMAARCGLGSAGRSESQDICFIDGNDHVGFLDSLVAAKEGPIVDVGGARLGTHQGVHRYTIGQRKGLGPLGRRMFVKEIHPDTNTVVVGTEDDLGCHRIEVRKFIRGPVEIGVGDTFDAQIRYKSAPAAARVETIDDDRVVLAFEEPVRAVAPGQAAVLYRGDSVVGGGTIEKALSAV